MTADLTRGASSPRTADTSCLWVSVQRGPKVVRVRPAPLHLAAYRPNIGTREGVPR